MWDQATLQAHIYRLIFGNIIPCLSFSMSVVAPAGARVWVDSEPTARSSVL